MSRVVSLMSSNRINYCRIWLGQEQWDIEHEKCGYYDVAKAEVQRRFLALAWANNIRVNLCLEHFRDIPPVKRQWSDKSQFHVDNGGPYKSMEQFLNGEKGVSRFNRKLVFYRTLYGDNPAIFGWQLWNEVDCVNGNWLLFTRTMLPELHRVFSRNLVTQSLGSLDCEERRERYQTVCAMDVNSVAMVHRYLDPGASLEVCRGPVDILLADAVRELRTFSPNKPILVQETGAVKTNLAGWCSDLYAKDPEGTLLHDFIFAPFFAGAAGSGQPWFWEESIDKPGLWFHFARFARAIEGVDPAGERFKPVMINHPRLRIYALKGRTMLLAWCRDGQNDWRSELEQGNLPELLKGVRLDLDELRGGRAVRSVYCYDPWRNGWLQPEIRDKSVWLPSFKRSIVIKVRYGK
jgi:hypothetical protein